MSNNIDRIQEIKRNHADAQRELEEMDMSLIPLEHQDRACLLSEYDRMKEALEWYADDRNYKLGNQTAIGEKARTALSHLKG